MQEESASSPSIAQVGGIIPHFYFDLIGRIAPGGLFFLGLGILYFPDSLSKFVKLFTPPIEKDSGTYLIFVASLSLLGLCFVGYFVGSFLGTISYHVVEWNWPDWTIFNHEAFKTIKRIAPFPALDTTTVFHKSQPAKEALQKRFQNHFGEHFTDTPSGSLTDYSRLCSYFVWARSVNLGQMTARWDAEALAGRNVFFGATTLLVLRLIQAGRNTHDIFQVSMFVVMIAAGLHYHYQRRTQVSGRYLLFWAVSQDENPATPA